MYELSLESLPLQWALAHIRSPASESILLTFFHSWIFAESKHTCTMAGGSSIFEAQSLRAVATAGRNFVPSCCLDALQWGLRAGMEKQQSRGGGCQLVVQRSLCLKTSGGGGFEGVEES